MSAAFLISKKQDRQKSQDMSFAETLRDKKKVANARIPLQIQIFNNNKEITPNVRQLNQYPLSKIRTKFSALITMYEH